MKDEELIRLFLRGLIPGPRESEESFIVRTVKSPSLSLPEWKEVAAHTSSCFGFSIDWMPVVYGGRKLFFWEGGAMWVGETAYIQLQEALRTRTYFGYRRFEIVAHEAVHAARVQFQEPGFEEILAYSVSTVAWKRWLGPLFTHPWESLFFLLTLCMGVWSLWIPSAVLLFLLGKLSWKQFLFRKRKKTFPLPILICLTDQEIKRGILPKDFTLRARLIRLLQKEQIIH